MECLSYSKWTIANLNLGDREINLPIQDFWELGRTTFTSHPEKKKIMISDNWARLDDSHSTENPGEMQVETKNIGRLF